MLGVMRTSWMLTMVLTLCAVIALAAGATSGSAQTVCRAGQLACGARCYEPARGQQCLPSGVVCGPGQQACGMRCFSPASGQQCFASGAICGPGEQACGMRCYSPARGERCFP